MNTKETTTLLPDRIEGRRIILDAKGKFPKIVVIKEGSCSREYRLLKTRSGGYQLIK
jgi:hypothetical protein